MRCPRFLPTQRGIALILVLWVVALLIIIAVGLTATQRTESTLAANQIATSRFRALAEAGINYAILNLLAQPPLVEGDEPSSDLWIPDGVARQWAFDGETLDIALVNESSLIDLNRAGQDLLNALLVATGIPEDETAPLVDAILDWRDENDLHLLNGAEDADYESVGLPYGAKDGPFDSVEELQQVLGFDRELYRKIAPALTVDAAADRPETEFAPPLVLAALEGITVEEMELRLEEQRLAEEAARDGQPISPFNRGGPLYRIRVGQGGKGTPLMSMEALVSVSPGGETPFRVLWRRYGLTTEAPSGAEPEAEPR